MTDKAPKKLNKLIDRHLGIVFVSGVVTFGVAVGGCVELLEYYEQSLDEKDEKEQEEAAQRIRSELEDDGFEASSFSTTKTAAKLIIDDCIVETNFSAVGGGWNGLDELEDITSYTVTQKTNDGKVTRITEFENFSDLQSQTDDNPCAYFFVD
jgi:hypothetical protein